MSEARSRCRRCHSKLSEPTENPLDAFCSTGCHRIYYTAKCMVCEGKKSGRGACCSRPRCRSELAAKKRYGTMGRLYPTGRAKLGSADPAKIGVSEDARATRGVRQVAGPPLSPKDLRLATLGNPFDLDRKLSRRHEADGHFEDIEWCEAISPDGVRCFVAIAAHEIIRSAWLHRNSRHREGITNG
jgi:hypothetical protein